MCFEGLAGLSRRVWRRFVRGSREILLVPSLHRASTDALITYWKLMNVRKGMVAAVRSGSTLLDLTTVTVSVAFSSSMTHTVKVLYVISK